MSAVLQDQFLHRFTQANDHWRLLDSARKVYDVLEHGPSEGLPGLAIIAKTELPPALVYMALVAMEGRGFAEVESHQYQFNNPDDRRSRCLWRLI